MVQLHRTYVPTNIHWRIKKYAADKDIKLSEAYRRVIDMVLDEKGEERGEHVRLTADQINAIKSLAEEMKQSFSQVAKGLMDISLILMFQDVPFRDVVIVGMPQFLSRLRVERPQLADRIVEEYGKKGSK